MAACWRSSAWVARRLPSAGRFRTLAADAAPSMLCGGEHVGRAARRRQELHIVGSAGSSGSSAALSGRACGFAAAGAKRSAMARLSRSVEWSKEMPRPTRSSSGSGSNRRSGTISGTTAARPVLEDRLDRATLAWRDTSGSRSQCRSGCTARRERGEVRTPACAQLDLLRRAPAGGRAARLRCQICLRSRCVRPRLLISTIRRRRNRTGRRRRRAVGVHIDRQSRLASRLEAEVAEHAAVAVMQRPGGGWRQRGERAGERIDGDRRQHQLAAQARRCPSPLSSCRRPEQRAAAERTRRRGPASASAGRTGWRPAGPAGCGWRRWWRALRLGSAADQVSRLALRPRRPRAAGSPALSRATLEPAPREAAAAGPGRRPGTPYTRTRLRR